MYARHRDCCIEMLSKQSANFTTEGFNLFTSYFRITLYCTEKVTCVQNVFISCCPAVYYLCDVIISALNSIARRSRQIGRVLQIRKHLILQVLKLHCCILNIFCKFLVATHVGQFYVKLSDYTLGRYKVNFEFI